MFAHMAIIRDILLGAEKRKGNLQAMCELLDIQPSEIYQSDIQVPFEKCYRVWDIAVAQTGDPHLGLHIGEQTNPSVLGMVGYLMQSCPNLLEAFKTVTKFSGVTTDLFTYSLDTKGNQIHLSFQPCTPWIKISPATAHQAVEQAMAGCMNVFKTLSGKKLVPAQVHFSYRRTKNLWEYERVFQAPIKWGATSNTLIFTHEQLMSPVLSYDESMMGVFCDLVKQRITKMKAETFENLVKREIMTTFKGQLPSIESMAARLNMTVRSLQRKLEEERLSYRTLCNGLGKDFATSLLSNPQAKVAEVAAALGYSDPRAFQRAFKSWTGKTPREFRGREVNGEL